MLRRFLYLDEPALDGYLSSLEGGLTVRLERSRSTDKSGEGKLNLGPARGGGSMGVSEAENSEIADTPHAKFERLLRLAEADEEAAGWHNLPQLDQLAEVGQGALVDVECEAYIPDAVRFLSSQGGEAMNTLLDLMPLADTFGLDAGEFPKADEVKAVSSFLTRMSSDLVFVGEDESDWRIAGRLLAAHVQDKEIDGFVRVVGKVATRWTENRWKPLLALPGASLVPRKERKALESQKPKDDDDDSFLEGPAVMLDVLAIYR